MTNIIPQEIVYAVEACGNFTPSYNTGDDKISFVIPDNLPPGTGSPLAANTNYQLDIGYRGSGIMISIQVTTDGNKKFSVEINTSNKKIFVNGIQTTYSGGGAAIDNLIFALQSNGELWYAVGNMGPIGLNKICDGTIYTTNQRDCTINISSPPNGSYFEVGEAVSVNGSLQPDTNLGIVIRALDPGGNTAASSCTQTSATGDFNGQIQIPDGAAVGTWHIRVSKQLQPALTCSYEENSLCEEKAFQVRTEQVNNEIKVTFTNICSFISSNEGDDERLKCEACARGDYTNADGTKVKSQGIYTPFGCIEAQPQAFVEKLLRLAIGIAGGIAFLMIIYGGFVIMTSMGNPEHLNNGKEIITSAIAGLLLIVFSVIILKIIGVDILGIPEFGV